MLSVSPAILTRFFISHSHFSMNSSSVAPSLRWCAFLLWQRKGSFPANEQVEKVFQGIWEDTFKITYLCCGEKWTYKKKSLACVSLGKEYFFGPGISHDEVSQLASQGSPALSNHSQWYLTLPSLNLKASNGGKLWQNGPTVLYHHACLLHWIYLNEKEELHEGVNAWRSK